MIKSYLLAVTIFLEILFVWLELNELANYYEAIKNQLFESFNTRMLQRKFEKKRATRNIFKILIVGSLVLFGISLTVQSQKVILARIMCKNVMFIRKNNSREKSF